MRRNTNGRVAAALPGATALALGVVLLAAPTATAGGGDTKRVRLLDDCEPTSFNAAIGPGTCVGDGDTTIEEFLEELAENGLRANKSANQWKNAPDDFHIDEGDRLRVVNLGGEFHTFTEVEKFGGGCVPEVNHALGLAETDVIDECQDPSLFATTGVAAGETIHVHGLSVGEHKFECLIHPWMQSVVTVRADDDDHDDHD